MFEFRSNRESGETFSSRERYLRDKTGEAPFNRRICHALAHVNEPLSRRPRGAEDQDALDGHNEDEAQGEPRPGFPWITLILGSGCYRPTDTKTVALIEGIAAGVRDALAPRPAPPDDTAPADLGAAFAASLVLDRLGITTPDVAAAVRPVPGHAADLIYAAALLARFFHRVKALTAQAPSRWGNDVAVLPADFQQSDDIVADLVEPARDVLVGLEGAYPIDDDARPVEGAIGRLLMAIRSDLDTAGEHRPTVHAVHLRVLAECAWHELTLDTPVYPGWSDLLVDLSLYGRLLPAPNVGRPRPLFDSLEFAPQLIRGRYENPTKASWAAAHADQGGDGPDTIHDRAAALLHSQAMLRASVVETSQPPVAALFVTTFDLEVEMALWRHPSRRPYLVAVPVYVYRGDQGDLERTASLCWLGARIEPDHDLEPDEQLDRIRRPREWMVLSNAKRYERRFGNLPIVVRLSGCPSIDLPPLEGEPGQLAAQLQQLVGDRPVDAIGHAVLLDEYASLLHTSVDGLTTNAKVTADDQRFGLPDEITGVTRNKQSFARFWMIMGVQMADSSVRFRLTSQIAGPTTSLAISDRGRWPRRAGVVVNQRLDVTEQDLLYWFGFDIVTDSCQRFVGDLDHYVRHLQEPELRTPPRTECPIR